MIDQVEGRWPAVDLVLADQLAMFADESLTLLIGADDLAHTSPEALLPSLYVSAAPTAQRWLDVAESLPADHFESSP